MDIQNKKIVIAGGIRTPIGHLSKSLAHISPEVLMGSTIRELIQKTNLDPNAVDGVLVGWVGQGSHAPNIARIASLQSGRLPEKAHAMTVQANCVSGIESICSAARHIILGEGKLYIAGGTESMSSLPYAIRGPRSSKTLRSLDQVKQNWNQLWNDNDVVITDTMEEGLTDPVRNLNMAATAEVCAQMYGISRDQQDAYAHESFKRCYEAQESGFYQSHTFPFKQEGQTILEKDEYVHLRKGLVSKPAMIKKAPPLFDSEAFSIKDFYEKFGKYIKNTDFKDDAQATITLFNACARSDGAAAVIVTSEETAKELGLEILGEISSWAFHGIDPAYMGISPAYASQVALERSHIKFKDLDQIELHEAFSATCLSIFHLGDKELGHNWQASWESKKINPHGGTIPLGHPLAATGTRVILNLLYAMKANPNAQYGLATACAAGGLGGAMVIKRA